MSSKAAKKITEPHDAVIPIVNEYNTHKIIEAFKTLGCQLHMSEEKLTLYFPNHLNKFQKNELRLAFHKDRDSLFKVLRPEMERQFKINPAADMVRVV